MAYDIFISYRREGGAGCARILKAELEKRGYRDRVFLDYDELKDGRFDRRIMDAIDSAPVFIFILSPGSLDRCVNADDWVRKEILYAIERERHIIPVNFDKLFDGFPASLPEELRSALGQHQFSQVDSETLLNESIEKMIRERIAPLVARRSEYEVRLGDVAGGGQTGAEIHVMADAGCHLYRFGKPVCDIAAGVDTVVRLVKGNHQLEFVSIDMPDVKETMRYSVPDNVYSDFVEVKLCECIERERRKKVRLFLVKDNGGKYRIVDIKNRIVVDLKYTVIMCFREGFAAVAFNGNWGYIDIMGREVIECKYDNAEYSVFSEGLVAVQLNGKWGYVDTAGREVIELKYDYASHFSEGLASVKFNGKYGYIDMTGREVIKCKYKPVYGFSEGLASVKFNGKYGYIDTAGREVIECKYGYATAFSEGLAAVEFNGKWSYIDTTGREVIKCKYEPVLFGGDFREGLAAVELNGKYGYIDTTGREVIECKYGFATAFSEGLAAVELNGKRGYIDITGREVIECKYGYASDFQKGLAVVTLNEKYGVIDCHGNEVIPFSCGYTDISIAAGD